MVAHVVERHHRFASERVLDLEVPLKIFGVRHVGVGRRNGWGAEDTSISRGGGTNAGQCSTGLETLQQRLVGTGGCRECATGDSGCDIETIDVETGHERRIAYAAFHDLPRIQVGENSEASPEDRIVPYAVSKADPRLPYDSFHFGEPLLQSGLDRCIVRRVRIVIQAEEAASKTREAALGAGLVRVSVGTQRKSQLQLCGCAPHVLGIQTQTVVAKAGLIGRLEALVQAIGNSVEEGCHAKDLQQPGSIPKWRKVGEPISLQVYAKFQIMVALRPRDIVYQLGL